MNPTKTVHPGLDLVLEQMQPVRHLLLDPDISEVIINPNGDVYVERAGLLEKQAVRLASGDLEPAVKRIARQLGADISDAHPLFEGRLQDGSRVSAAMPPCCVGGICVSIRKFRPTRFSAEELVDLGMLTAEMLGWLRTAIETRQTILITGGAGSGKTSLLNALAAFFPPQDRIVIIEDTTEICIHAPHLIRLEARQEEPVVTIRDLLRHTLRMRPDRIIVGEVRGAEALDLLQALNTGHRGSLSTIHANSARDAIGRLRVCVAMAGVEMPDRVVALQIAAAVKVLVHIERLDGHRHVTEVLKLDRYNAARDEYEFTQVS